MSEPRPTVSHICSLTCLPSMLIMRAPNSTPMVRSCTGWKRLSVNCRSRQDFPTPAGHSKALSSLSGRLTELRCLQAAGRACIAYDDVLEQIPAHCLRQQPAAQPRNCQGTRHQLGNKLTRRTWRRSLRLLWTLTGSAYGVLDLSASPAVRESG